METSPPPPPPPPPKKKKKKKKTKKNKKKKKKHNINIKNQELGFIKSLLHYENMLIQIYWKFYHQKMKIFGF